MWKSQFDDRALKSYLLCFNISRFWICTYTECSNCNAKDLRINKLESQKQVLETRVRMLEARLEMARNPDDHDHVCQSDAILRELLSDMENLCSCLIKFYYRTWHTPVSWWVEPKPRFLYIKAHSGSVM